MANANVLELTDDNFDQEVLSSSQPVLVDIWASWCAPCRALAPTIDELANEYAGRVKVGKLDTDANQAVAGKLGISAIPTVILYKDGQIVRRFVGVSPKDEYVAELNKVA